MNTIQQSLLVERTGSHSTLTDNNPPTQVDCIAELERVNSAIDGRLGDPGPLQPTARRVESIVGELEKRLAQVTKERDNARLTLEAIGRAEGV